MVSGFFYILIDISWSTQEETNMKFDNKRLANVFIILSLVRISGFIVAALKQIEFTSPLFPMDVTHAIVRGNLKTALISIFLLGVAILFRLYSRYIAVIVICIILILAPNYYFAYLATL
jgi:hypothetical protein